MLTPPPPILAHSTRQEFFQRGDYVLLSLTLVFLSSVPDVTARFLNRDLTAGTPILNPLRRVFRAPPGLPPPHRGCCALSTYPRSPTYQTVYSICFDPPLVPEPLGVLTRHGSNRLCMLTEVGFSTRGCQVTSISTSTSISISRLRGELPGFVLCQSQHLLRYRAHISQRGRLGTLTRASLALENIRHHLQLTVLRSTSIVRLPKLDPRRPPRTSPEGKKSLFRCTTY
ncbi:hypothetical protein BJ875DRAFT_79787 [Amylocarpus encephaloides]|uniref:Uncharacterized protein n=1 Tax=Amylocarpus encephaloides TaxID=45428 RepID=A0A9P8C4W4_9HELO|nr:hypothetical protein BJ875DRAFT_79787 [Amylocarpus encephaloides]